MTDNPHKKAVLIVAGEASAERYGARLVRKLSAECGPGETPEFFGTGGNEMEQAGVRLVCHIRELASIGPRESVSHLVRYYRTFRRLIELARARRPAAAVLIDFPEFNLRLAKRLKRAGIPVIYYIGPQLWAWRAGRIRIVKQYVDRMLVILPFEKEYYRRRGVNAEFVGHPLLEDSAPVQRREDFLLRYHLDPARQTVALLPGSRRKEVEHILPSLLEAALEIRKRVQAQFVVSAAPAVGVEYVQLLAARVAGGRVDESGFRVVTAEARDILANVDFAMVKSGTSTLEAAMVGTPFLIVYKISALSWAVGQALIRVPHWGLVNLIAGDKIVPEFVQENATPELLSRTTLEYLASREKREAMRSKLAGIRSVLGASCATDAVAAVVRRYL